MSLTPQPRFRLYGSPVTYRTTAAHIFGVAPANRCAIESLEDALMSRLGENNVIAVMQARLGLYLAVKHLIEPGQKVILSPYTIYDVVNMVIAAGGVPVFADIEEETCNISLKSAKALIDSATSGIIITHLHGLCADARGFERLCSRNNLWLIEDAAQAFGATIEGTPAGTIGTAGVYSFGRAKNVNGFYGGAVVTRRADLARKIRQEIATYPEAETGMLTKRIAMSLAYDFFTAPVLFPLATFPILRWAHKKGARGIARALNTEHRAALREAIPPHYLRRMTALQAAIILAQLPRVDAHTRRRIELAGQYASLLKGVHGIRLPPMRDDGSHIYLAYPIQVGDRDVFVAHMLEHGRDITPQHMRNLSDHECFKAYARPCPVAQIVSQKVLLLPTYPSYSDVEVKRTGSTVRMIAAGMLPRAHSVDGAHPVGH